MFQKGVVSGRIIRLPVSSVPKSFEDLANKGRTRYVTTVNLPSLPEERIPADPNPRNHTPVTSSKLSGLKDSIIENSGNFVFKNLGITILADKTNYDTKSKILTIDLGKKGGVSNGNTTLNYCQEYGKESYNEHVLLTIFTNITDDDDIIEMAEGQNTSINVDKTSLLNLDDQFDKLKDELKECNALDKVSFVQNDRKEMDVKYVLRLLAALKPDTVLTAKIKSYTSASSCVDEYIHNKAEYNMFVKCIPNILELNDLIRTRAKLLYNEETNGKALALKFFTQNKDRRVFFSEFANETIADSIFFPVLSAYNELFEVKNKKYQLKPFVKKITLEKIVDDTLGDLINGCKNLLGKEHNHNLNAFGKSSATWENLSNIVFRYIVKK